MQIPEDLSLIPSDSRRLCKRDDDWNQFLILSSSWKGADESRNFPSNTEASNPGGKPADLCKNSKCERKQTNNRNLQPLDFDGGGKFILVVVKSAVVGFYCQKKWNLRPSSDQMGELNAQPMEQINLSTFIALPSLFTWRICTQNH